MKPKPQPRDEFELFQSHFDQILNRKHELVQLADRIDWSRFDVAFADSYSQDMGAPAKAVRLMVGLQYLKYTFNESDESVVDRWVETLLLRFHRHHIVLAEGSQELSQHQIDPLQQPL